MEQSTSVYEAICTMFLEDCGTLFIVDKQSTLVGVVSRKDLLRASMGGQSIDTVPVSIIMTRMPNITMCEKDDSIIEVAQKLISRQIDGLPIVKKVENGSGYEVIGRITKTNMTSLLVDLSSNDIN